jgi:hypothetical protein
MTAPHAVLLAAPCVSDPNAKTPGCNTERVRLSGTLRLCFNPPAAKKPHRSRPT